MSRASQLFMPTLRQNPADIKDRVHAAMLRGGFIYPITPGGFILQPLMWRVMNKVIAIVREEIDRYGGQEMLLPMLLPVDQWERTGRTKTMAKVLYRLDDPSGAHLLLGPTYEEPITDMIGSLVTSHRQLPLTLYQIASKFRFEARPRAGLQRLREFLMKDAYSFGRDAKDLDDAYRQMVFAYWRVFLRCGLGTVLQIQADSGAIGGSASEEFMVPANSGEDTVLSCDNCAYVANEERAVSLISQPISDDILEEMECIHTPEVKTIDQLVASLGVSTDKIVKTLIYTANLIDGSSKVIAVLIRGDRSVNEVKLKNALGSDCLSVAPAEPWIVEETTSSAVGFAGPVGLESPMIADASVEGLTNFLTGANKTDYHYVGVNWGRDVDLPQVVDLRSADAGDCCPHCSGGVLQKKKGIEVGHLFKLGTKYSQTLGAKYTNEQGEQIPIEMGCYGIGMTRIPVAALEINTAEKGIIWPISITPYHAVIVMSTMQDTRIMTVAEQIYREGTESNGTEIVIDDRDMAFGAKMNDWELMGVPFIVVVGRRVNDGCVEIRNRLTREQIDVEIENAASWLSKEVHQEEFRLNSLADNKTVELVEDLGFPN